MQGAKGKRCAVAKNGKQEAERRVGAPPDGEDRGERVLVYGLMALSGGIAGALVTAGLGAAAMALLAVVAGCGAGWLARGVFR